MKRLVHTVPGTMLLLLAVVTLLGACKPARPGGILSPGEMEDVLYDYHLAIGLAQTEANGDAVKELAYKDAVLRKHGVGQDEFDSSMVYYMRHADQLHTIYAALSDRLDKEAVSWVPMPVTLADTETLHPRAIPPTSGRARPRWYW